MKFHSATCSACKKEIPVPTDVTTARCMYCGAQVSVENPQSSQKPGTENLLGMARTAEAAGNLPEAVGYYNRVLEVDPTLSEAWLGKGRAAAWQSTIVDMRLGELLVPFNHAIANADPAHKENVISECVGECNRLVVALYGMARKHLLEFVALPNIWPAYIAQVAQMLDALEAVHTWQPGDRQTLETIIHLVKDNIEGITYRDQFDNGIPKGWHLSPEYEALMRTRLSSAVTALQELDPNYTPPTVEVKRPDTCFVVTATMGDEHHPTVQFLRRFRNEWILAQRWGSAFVGAYYEHGPHAAAFISKGRWRRRIAFAVIVMPAKWIAERILR